MIPYGRQSINQDDIDAVVEVLRSDFLTQGPAVPAFERALAAHCHAKHAVAVNSGTSALHIACLALNLGPGDWLWTSPNTFVASANCALYCGAVVDFVDIDPRTYNMSVDALTIKLQQAEREGRLPKVVIPVHFGGQSCDMQEIHRLGQRYGFRIIEDASHAVGARYRNQPVGDCRYSDITVFSFHPVKIITAGEGGMALTNDAQLAARLDRLRTHGITRDPGTMHSEPPGPWYYEQVELGMNYRMTDLQAALAVSQLRRLEKFVTRREDIARTYDEALAQLPLTLPWQHPDTASAWHLYVVQIDSSRARKNRDEVFREMRRAGVHVNVHYIPVHTQPYYRQLGFREGHFPMAELYYSRTLTLPIYAALTPQEQATVIQTLHRLLH